jgi:hypothetical protein
MTDPRDHRRVAAMQTSQSERGWDFRPADEVPLWFCAVAEVLRPRSLILLAVVAGVVSLWWLT